MAYPYGIEPNPYVTSIWTSNLTQECMHASEPVWSWVLPLYVWQGEGLGYPQLPLFPFGMWDPEVVWAIYHFTPFSTEFLGPKSYRHPGPPPPLQWCGGAISCPKGT